LSVSIYYEKPKLLLSFVFTLAYPDFTLQDLIQSEWHLCNGCSYVSHTEAHLSSLS